ncbi:MAG: gliding motility-associated C-terminal domain-containing protein [Bacteroidetes bacterium]|nr:gliding motility-associated C-terminal domain-containing protein [Bacteroidota bacterium]
MKKKLFICLAGLFVFTAAAQRDSILNNKMNTLKKTGQLNGGEGYYNPNGGTPLVITMPPKASRRNGGNNQVMSSTSCNCWIPRDITFSVVPFNGSGGSGGPGMPPNYANDDWSTVGIALPFNFCLYGTTVGNAGDSLYINNNGNLTFGTPFWTYSGASFPCTAGGSTPGACLAPFWGDVETTNPGSGFVYYQLTPTHLIVQWDSVDCYQMGGGANANLHNTFQIIITNGSDPILPPGNNVSFCYGTMQWTTGDASSPSPSGSGFGGPYPATVGINKGDGSTYVQVSRFNAANATYTNPAGTPPSGVYWLNNKSFFFNACASGSNIPPVCTSGISPCGMDTLTICSVGDSMTKQVNFIGPEPTQQVTVAISSSNLPPSALSVVSATPGTTGSLTFMITSGGLSAGSTYSVNITATDNGTPAASTTITYIIRILNTALPSPNISVTPSVTCGSTPPETVTLNNASSYDSYTWSSGQTTPSFTTSTSGVVQVTVTKNGCSKTGAATVVFYPQPSISLGGILSYCPPSTNTTIFVTQPVTGGTAPFSYNWSNGATTYSTQVTGGSYSVTVTDAHGCTASGTTTVIANGVPTLSISAIGSLCAGVDTLVSSVTTATSYTWAGGAGIGSGPTYTVAAAGVYTLALTINSCTTMATYSLAPPIQPTLTVRDTSVCKGTLVTITPIVSPPSTYSYAWYNAANGLMGSGTTFSVDSAGVFHLTVTNNNTRCSATQTFSVSVAQNPTVTVTGNQTYCKGKSDSLKAVVAGGIAPYSYTWSPTGGSGSGALYVPTPPLSSSNMTYSVVVLDTKGCTASGQILLKQSNPRIFVPNNSICPGKCVVLGANGSGTAPLTYTWTNVDGSIKANTRRDTVCIPGTYSISMTDVYGCMATGTISVVYNPVPNANFTWAPTMPDMGTPAGFSNTSTVATGSISTYNWSFGDGSSTDTSSAMNPSYTYSLGGTYSVTLMVKSDKGCVSSTTETLSVQYVIVAPNVITPNGDGINEYLSFKNLEYYPNSTLQIFNRWGLRLYQNTNYQNDWTGKEYSDGTYFYILEVPKKGQTIKNFFELLKGK